MARSYQDLINDWKSSSYYVSNIANDPSKFYQWVYNLGDEDRNVMFNNGFLTSEQGRLGYDTYSGYQDLMNGRMSADEYQAWIGLNNAGKYVTPEMQEYLNNALSNQRTNEARDWEQYAAQNEYLWSGQQAQQLGLSPSVISFGGSSVNPLAAASTSNRNVAQERVINTYNQRMGLAKQLISMTGGMASAGIYGKALAAAKRSAGILSSSAAHSGLMAMKTISGRSYADVLAGMANK